MADPLHVMRVLHLALAAVIPTAGTGRWGEPWDTLVGAPLSILITLVLAVLVRWLLHRVIDRVARDTSTKHQARMGLLQGRTGKLFATATGFGSERHDARLATIASLAKSAVTIVVFGTALLTVLEVLGLPLAPLLASASVGGLAIGFGAQSLVRDFLSGIFMIAEDQYGVGDVIDTGNVVGTVEEVSLRITQLRDSDGTVWYVRNGEIQRIGNRSQGYSVAIVDVPVGYTENLTDVTAILTEAVAGIDELPEYAERLVSQPTVAGIEAMGGSTVTLRVTARCRANVRDGVQRDLRALVKTALDAHGVPVQSPPA
ncbi:MAG: mechanosensitive ion channel family protein [Actinomycetota bacterium]|nr:mechanosensitive ion channel family protein [Actinomycetota bacterium]